LSLFGAFLLFLAWPAGGTRPAAAQALDSVKVKVCHYDRNDQGPNAGPHVIEVNENAVDSHLENHTKTNDYVGNDFVIHNDDDEDRCKNEEKDTFLVITKECTGGVTGGSFNINLSNDKSKSFTLGCGGSTDPIAVKAGEDLTVHETTTGFDTSYRGACDGDGSVILEKGKTNTCVVSNAGLTTLTVTKECGEGVTSADGPFNFTLEGSINDTFSIATCGGSHQVEGVNANDTGILSETNTGFDVSIRGDCDGDGSLQLIANDNNVCVVRNDPVEEPTETTLVITKECTGGVTGGSFDIDLTGTMSDSFTLGCGTSTDPITVDPDADLTVQETTTGFDTSYRGACDGDGSVILVEDEENTCVVSNAGLITLTITKECGDGVTSADGPFNFTLTGTINDTFSIATCGGSHEVVGVNEDDTGVLSETNTGFDVSIRGDCDGDGTLLLIANDDNVCVVRNDLPGAEEATTLVITKECGDGVTSADGPFNFTLTGTISDTFSIATCGGSHEVIGVSSDDTGVLSETNTGFDVSIRGDCDGDGTLLLIANDDNVCVVRNDVPGQVITVLPTEVPTSIPPAALVEATALPPAAPVEVVVEAAPTAVPTTEAAAVLGVTALPSTGSGGSALPGNVSPWLLLTALLAGLGGLALLSSRVIRP
jgi:hypothetical protein